MWDFPIFWPSWGPEMKRKRFSEEQIIALLREHEAVARVPDLARRHGVRIVLDADDAVTSGTQRRYDGANRVLHLASHLRPGQHAFQMATQLAFLEMGAQLHRTAEEAAY